MPKTLRLLFLLFFLGITVGRAPGEETTGKVWFITGSSSGFGLAFTRAALERGDGVAATALDPEVHDELKKKYGAKVLPLRLDVTKRDEIAKAVAEATRHFGRLDVVINNAGFGQFGMIEEFSEEEFRKQLETNLFGSFNVIQGVLPVLREQQSGHLIQVSSLAGVVTMPMLGAYSASKWGVEGLCETLAMEVAPLGIKVSIIEPGPFKTGFTKAARVVEKRIEAYAAQTEAFHRNLEQAEFEDPAKVVNVVLKLVDAKEPPLRVLVGKGTVETVEKVYQKRLETWREWKDRP